MTSEVINANISIIDIKFRRIEIAIISISRGVGQFLQNYIYGAAYIQTFMRFLHLSCFLVNYSYTPAVWESAYHSSFIFIEISTNAYRAEQIRIILTGPIVWWLSEKSFINSNALMFITFACYHLVKQYSIKLNNINWKGLTLTIIIFY